MDDLIAFLNARLDEGEAAAKAATPGPWVVGRTSGEDGEWNYGSHVAAMGEEKRMLLDMCTGYTRSKHVGTAEHIALHDPGRALRDVAADRQLLREYDVAYRTTAQEGLRLAVRIRAAVHSDHPGYRPEWKP